MSTKNAVRIPVIDISETNPHASAQLLDAACRFGFVFIANHHADGVDPALIHKMFRLSKDFFALPRETKGQYAISSNVAGKNNGWLGPVGIPCSGSMAKYGQPIPDATVRAWPSFPSNLQQDCRSWRANDWQGIEKLDPQVQKRPDVKEAFNMGEPVNNGFEQPLPELLEQNLESLLAFQTACHSLCMRVLQHFASALDIHRDWFTSRHDRSKGQSGTVFRFLYYPRTTDQESGVDIRAGAHSDYGTLTCLFQLPGQPGLEIKTPEGTWAPVPVDPQADDSSSQGQDRPLPILLNIGDLLEDWTGGLLKSTVHRVVFPQGKSEDRYSMAYFLQPLDDALLEPVPSKLVEEHLSKAERPRDSAIITARDHLMARLAATYSIK